MSALDTATDVQIAELAERLGEISDELQELRETQDETLRAVQELRGFAEQLVNTLGSIQLPPALARMLGIGAAPDEER